MKNLRVDDDFKNCLPPLSNEEYGRLEESLLKNGVISPILVWNGYVVDGHNRYALCEKHNIDFPVKEMSFSSKGEAIEWILQNQLGRRNLTDFQKNEIALRYEDVIARRMRERQIEGQEKGRERRYSGLRPNGHEPEKSKPTTRRAELAKIAGTSQGSIQRSKLILEKGTPEQIERARKGGAGNSVSAIAKEIEQGDVSELRTCTICGRKLPSSEFYIHHKNQCKHCLNTRRRSKDIKGKTIGISPELMKITEDEIIGDLYDTEKEIEYTDEDLREELNATIENFKWSVQNCLKIHMEILRNEKSKDKVLRNLTLLQNEIQKWKESFDYE